MVVEPLHDKITLAQRIQELKPSAIGIIFYHGLGDLIMFLPSYRRLSLLYPGVRFTLMLQAGLGFEEVCPDAFLMPGGFMENLESQPYDLIAKVHFPMEDVTQDKTKAEICCEVELGIPPFADHGWLAPRRNPLVAVHFNITCLPDAANPDRETAFKIWNEIKAAGFIPIETHFQHTFHNPVNEKFDFIDCTVRSCPPRINNLIGLLQNSAAFIGVVSGNFHTALASLPHARIMLLEKHLCLGCFTRLPLARVNIKPGEYPEGSVKKWLENLPI